MLASLYNPKIQRGGTFTNTITAEDANGVDRDFSEYDLVRMDIRPAWVGKPGSISGDPLLSLSTTSGEIVVATTTITITLSAAVTAALTFDSGKYELELVKNAVGETPEIVDKLLYGTVYVTGEIVV